MKEPVVKLETLSFACDFHFYSLIVLIRLQISVSHGVWSGEMSLFLAPGLFFVYGQTTYNVTCSVTLVDSKETVRVELLLSFRNQWVSFLIVHGA